MASNMLEPGIITHPRPKKSILPPTNKRRKIEHKIEEISFDNTARADYLTGFHKRKVARAKQAQVEAAKKAKEERVLVRKQLREERKQELEEHVEAVNALLKDVNGGSTFDSDDDDAWNGFDDGDGALAPEPVDHEEEYIDEDRYTTVTVETVEVDKQGLHKAVDSDDESEEDEAPKLVEAETKTGDTKKKWPKKPRKQKFRYESKVERKMNRAKQKAGNKKRADARKGD